MSKNPAAYSPIPVRELNDPGAPKRGVAAALSKRRKDCRLSMRGSNDCFAR